MKSQLTFLFFLTLILFSCSRNKNTAISIETIDFKETTSGCIVNTYYDKKQKQDLIYFCGRGVKKNIKLFTVNGKLVKTIPLTNVLKLIDEIGGISIISMDTIVINSNYTNQILLINNVGEVWKEINLNNKLIDKDANIYELMASIDANNNTLESLIYCSYWRSNSKDIEQSKEPKGNLEYLKYFYKNCYNTPHFISLANVLDSSIKIEYHLQHFYKQISKEVRVFAEPPFYTIQNNALFVYSLYSDTLFQYSRDDFSLKNKIKISSDFTKIGTSLMKINENNIRNGQDSVTFKINREGRIIKFIYSPSKNKYYCIVKHQVLKENVDTQKNPFSIAVYDTNFIKLDEHLFNDNNYDYNHALFTNNGLMLLKKDTTKSLIKNEKCTYSLLEFN